MQEVGDSRQQTEEEKRSLRLEEAEILKDIVNSNGTLKSKITRWAEILERRIELLDLNFAVSEICTYIRNILGELPLAHNVNRYLSEKYKNPNQMRFQNMENKFQQLQNRTQVEYDNLEECSSDTLPTLLEKEKNEKNKADEFVSEAKKIVSFHDTRVWDIRRELLRRGITKCLDEEYRDPISCYDFRMPVPDNQKLHWYNQQTSENLIATGQAIAEFGAKDFLEFPPHDTEIAKKYAETSRIWRILFLTVKEKKWSGDVGFWMDRNFWQKVQSSHDSGNSTKFDTTLCAWCSRDIDSDPADRHIMKYDRDSPTTYKCDNCGGTAVLDRGNTREQVGDKKEENDRLAADVINHAPYYGQLFGDWRERWLNATIYARKRAISNEFSISSFGKEKIVVPKKK